MNTTACKRRLLTGLGSSHRRRCVAGTPGGKWRRHSEPSRRLLPSQTLADFEAVRRVVLGGWVQRPDAQGDASAEARLRLFDSLLPSCSRPRSSEAGAPPLFDEAARVLLAERLFDGSKRSGFGARAGRDAGLRSTGSGVCGLAERLRERLALADAIVDLCAPPLPAEWSR